LLNATSLFNHGNVRLPAWLDRVLRLVVVTSEMHRVHHSVRPRETNSNFGFCLPWWDYLLGIYRAQPADGHESMTVGLEQFRDERGRVEAYCAGAALGAGPLQGDRGHRATSAAAPAAGSRAARGRRRRRRTSWTCTSPGARRPRTGRSAAAATPSPWRPSAGSR